MSSIYEVIELGHIVFGDEELGVIITANSYYLNWFNSSVDGWINTDRRSTANKPYYEMTMSELKEVAEEYYNDIMKEG